MVDEADRDGIIFVRRKYFIFSQLRISIYNLKVFSRRKNQLMKLLDSTFCECFIWIIEEYVDRFVEMCLFVPFISYAYKSNTGFSIYLFKKFCFCETHSIDTWTILK